MEEILLDLCFVNSTWEFMLPLLLIASDVITGLIQAFINNDFQSCKMRQGLYHKVLEILMIGLGFAFSIAFNIHAIHVGVVIYIIVMELGSILENLCLAGINLGPLSKILKIMGKDKLSNILNENIKNVEK